MSRTTVPRARVQLFFVLLACAGLGCGGTAFKSGRPGEKDSGFAQLPSADAVASGAPETSDADAAFAGPEASDAFALASATPETGEVFAAADARSASRDLANPKCGNGIIDPGEECDDGNTYPGDGCSALCQVDNCRFGCWCTAFSAREVCGDGVLTHFEVCDDGNTNSGDGCASDCYTVEPGYRCAVLGRPCTPICGDGRVLATETCDDGNTVAGDGCSSICLTEPGWDCSSGACVRLSPVDGGSETGAVVLYCGDGILSGAEECDDGPRNKDNGYGGCSTLCKYIGCGDGILNGPEECDLGSENGSSHSNPDGCSVACARSHFCGDGIVDTAFGEQCDSGADNGLDGLCSLSCHDGPLCP